MKTLKPKQPEIFLLSRCNIRMVRELIKSRYPDSRIPIMSIEDAKKEGYLDKSFEPPVVYLLPFATDGRAERYPQVAILEGVTDEKTFTAQLREWIDSDEWKAIEEKWQEETAESVKKHVLYRGIPIASDWNE